MSDLDLGLLIMISFISANFFYLHYRLNRMADALDAASRCIYSMYASPTIYKAANTNLQD